ncbi:MAG: PorP/SprF family type IX secretion system membrane protein [Bacteroidales bacterium]
MVKNILFFIHIFCVLGVVEAQQSPNSTLYNYHQNSYNPAETAMNETADVSLILREQYMSFAENAGPSVVWFNSSLPLPSIKSGVGVAAKNQTQGFENRLDFKCNYSYHIQLSQGILSMGIGVGGTSIGWDIKNPIYPDGETDKYVDSRISGQDDFLNLLIDFGVYYKMRNLYTGFSITEMNEPKLTYEDGESDFYKRHYWFTSGYDYITSNPMFTVHPSMLVKTTLVNTQMSIDVSTIYNRLIIGGVSYTTNNDISLICGVKFGEGRKFEGMRAFFSYDIIGGEIRSQSSGNVEFMVGYSFNLTVDKVKKSYKSVRFL